MLGVELVDLTSSDAVIDLSASPPRAAPPLRRFREVIEVTDSPPRRSAVPETIDLDEDEDEDLDLRSQLPKRFGKEANEPMGVFDVPSRIAPRPAAVHAEHRRPVELRRLEEQQLGNEFPTVQNFDIQTFLRAYSYDYATTRRHLRSALEAFERGEMSAQAPFLTSLKQRKRPVKRLRGDSGILEVLQAEMAAANSSELAEKADAEHAAKLKRSFDEAAEQAARIECACCFCEFSFGQLTQCEEGHLFCAGCVQRYCEENVFGQTSKCLSAEGRLRCIDGGGCDAFFPTSELQRSLPAELLAKLDERLADLAVSQAHLVGLFKCPHCAHAVVLDDEVRTVACPKCAKKTCRQCSGEAHPGLKCDQVENTSEVRLCSARRTHATICTARPWACAVRTAYVCSLAD